MMANIERIRGSNGNGEAVRAIVTAARSAGAISLQVGNPVNFPNEFIGTWGTLNQATGLLDSSSIRVFYGKLNGSNIDIEGMAPGYTDDGNQVGDVVVLKPNTAWADELAEVLRTSLNDDGTFKESVVTTDKINNSAVTTAKIGDSQVTTAKINNLAVTTAKLANNSVTAAKADFSTYTPTTSNGWRVSADGRIATKKINHSGFQPFGASGNPYGTQGKPIGTLPSGFTLADCHIQLTAYAEGEKGAIVRGISGSNIVYANLTNQQIGNSSTTYDTNIMLVKTS